MAKENLEKTLEKKLKSIGNKKGIYLFISSPSQYNLVNSFILKYFTKSAKMLGIYVTLNKGVKPVERSLRDAGCDTSLLYFIDGITMTQNKDAKAANCTFIPSPEALTELSLAIKTAIDTKGFDFLYFDSVNTLLIYNEFKTSEKFVHFIIAKLREGDVGGIIFSLEDASASKIIPSIMQFCDESYDVSKLK